MLENLVSAAVESPDDVAARIRARREKWTPVEDAPTFEHGDAIVRIVQKVGGSTEMVEIERPNGRFSSYSLTDAALVHQIAQDYSAHLAKQTKSSGK